MQPATLTGMGRPKKAEPSDPLRLPRSVVRRVRRLAGHLRKEPGDYAAELLAPLLDKAEAKMLADMAKERGDAGK